MYSQTAGNLRNQDGEHQFETVRRLGQDRFNIVRGSGRNQCDIVYGAEQDGSVETDNTDAAIIRFPSERCNQAQGTPEFTDLSAISDIGSVPAAREQENPAVRTSKRHRRMDAGTVIACFILAAIFGIGLVSVGAVLLHVVFGMQNAAVFFSAYSLVQTALWMFFLLRSV